MAVNSLLFSVQNMAPAMLGVGPGKTQNYNNLADINASLFGNNSSGTNSVTDSVSLTYKKIADKVVSDMAAVTADAIKKYPDLDDEYVIAVIDNGNSREARVYKKSDILASFEGTDEEKAALEKQLTENPLMVFTSANGLPESSADEASQYLAKGLNAFLKTNAKIFDTLDKAGYDPLADMLGSSKLKKILAAFGDHKAESENKNKDSTTEKDSATTEA